MLGAPFAGYGTSFVGRAAVIAILFRPGVAAARAVGASALLYATPFVHAFERPFTSGTDWLARKGSLYAIATLSFVGTYFAARERHARNGIRLAIGLLAGAFVPEALLGMRLYGGARESITPAVVVLWAAWHRRSNLG